MDRLAPREVPEEAGSKQRVNLAAARRSGIYALHFDGGSLSVRQKAAVRKEVFCAEVYDGDERLLTEQLPEEARTIAGVAPWLQVPRAWRQFGFSHIQIYHTVLAFVDFGNIK